MQRTRAPAARRAPGAQGDRARQASRRDVLAALGATSGLLLLGCRGEPVDVRDQAAVAAGGSRGYAGPAVELSFWTGFTGGDRPPMERLLERFNREHDNITVRMSVTRWGDFYQKLPAAVDSGHGPDVAVMHADQLATAAVHHTILPLDEVVGALGLGAGDFSRTLWNAGVFRGHRYGIPLDVHPLGLYYNRAVLAHAGLGDVALPRARRDYLAVLEQLKGRGIQGSWVSPVLFTGGLMFQSLLWQLGGELFSEDGARATFNSEAGVEALDFMIELIKRGYSPRDVGQDADSIAFTNNRNAFHWNGIWMINVYRAIPGLEWGVAPVPAIGPREAVWGNSHNLVLPRQPRDGQRRLKASVVFLDWLSRHSIEWAEAGMVPARREARESAAFLRMTEQAIFATQIPHVRFPPAIAGIDSVRASTLDLAVNEAVLLRAPPREALDRAARAADALLSDNLRKFGRAT
ncbi:ABC transporter substrate-binding protein [Sorangium cellulosum]|uniref:ABC transporter substrate-binding protein n=1 Tax=Sorangium cellulosum TaxID=56 RepID=A0A4P2Q5X1_SORCE|nr:ABC transporter substrate-binding protein [Sorangium cellulosum]AUX24383.1 ABC transporter substrate-binding protein [Sorangium cellulosum]